MPFIMAPLIYSLFLPSRPSAIFRRIRTICIDAIQTFSFWTRSHVAKEILKGIAPTVTNRDASSAIKHVVHDIRVVTSAFHADPRTISRCDINVVLGLAVRRSKPTHFFSEVASTGKRVAGLQRTASYPASGATIANAFPKDLMAFSEVRSDHLPSAESAASKINKLFSGSYICDASSTPARFGFAFPQLTARNPFNLSAFALALPPQFAFALAYAPGPAFVISCYRPTAELLPC